MPAARDPTHDQLAARVRRLEPRLGGFGPDAVRAVEVAGDHPDVAVMLARKVTEGILQQVLQAEKGKSGSLQIEELKRELRGVVTGQILIHVETVQRWGNEGAHHRADAVTAQDAQVALGAFLQILTWWIRNYRGGHRRPTVPRWLLGASIVGIGGLAASLLGFAAFTTVQVGSLPMPGASLATVPVPPPAAATQGTVLYSRPLLPRESSAQPSCATGVVAVQLDEHVGPWARVHGTCDLALIAGWARVAGLPSDVPLPPAPTADDRGTARAVLDSPPASLDVRALDQALALVPDDPDLRALRGRMTLDAGAHLDALVDLTLCVALEPTNAMCLFDAARAEKALGMPEWALDRDAAIALDPALALSIPPGKAMVGEVGPAGLAVFPKRLGQRPLRRWTENRARPAGGEVCRLAPGVTVDVVGVEGGWAEVDVHCAGADRRAFLPIALDGQATLQPR